MRTEDIGRLFLFESSAGCSKMQPNCKAMISFASDLSHIMPLSDLTCVCACLRCFFFSLAESQQITASERCNLEMQSFETEITSDCQGLPYFWPQVAISKAHTLQGSPPGAICRQKR